MRRGLHKESEKWRRDIRTKDPEAARGSESAFACWKNKGRRRNGGATLLAITFAYL